MSALACVLIGGESLLVECGTMLLEQGHRVSAVVSQRPSVRNWAAERGIAVLDRPADLLSADVGPFDILFSITNLSILGSKVLALPRRAAINFHDGPLPDYAGLNTPVRALLNGELHHAITWHLMTSQIDGGDILVERAFAIDPDETAFSINTKCFSAAIESFPAVLDRIAAAERIEGTPQAARSGRYYGRDDRLECAATIRWDSPAQTIANLVRALDFGAHYNPLGAAKAMIAGTPILVRALRIEATNSGAMPGTICGIASDGITIATATNDVTLTDLADLGGQPVPPFALPVHIGDKADRIDPEQAKAVTALDSATAHHESWWRARFAALSPLRLPVVRPANASVAEAPTCDIVDLARSAEPNRAKIVATALVAYLARVADKPGFDVGFVSPVLVAQYGSAAAWFSRQVPLRVRVDFASGFTALRETLCAEMRELHRRVGFTADLIARDPGLTAPLPDSSGTALPVSVVIIDELEDAPHIPGAELVIAIRADGTATSWTYDQTRLDPAMARSLQDGFLTLLAAAEQAADMPLGELPVLDDATRLEVLETWNATTHPVPDGCIHELFERQAQLTPDRPAITCRDETLSYAELDSRSNKLAWYLQSLDVGPDTLVGLHMDRSVDMVVAVLAIHRAGAAYLPLDPEYPIARLHYMIEDSAVPIIVTRARLAERVRNLGARVVSLDTDHPLIDAQPGLAIAGGARPGSLAYVIYTSGSTGKPKGVMVEHRNVVNFFAGMDRKIEVGGTWLAVTSLNFDISVLELYWTLARGCHVVIAASDTAIPSSPDTASARPLAFSLFYFASADSGGASDQYRLLLEGAKFGDRNGFAAIWTPERHFHAFGGLYPNPSVAGAAIAAITSRIDIRGGSVVLPLHHPVRVAEEWSLVDNLSNGRVGIAFASGWQPNDFLLRPENFADKTGALVTGIDTVRRLWRGEQCSFPGPTGSDVTVGIYPRPVQPELPFWITSAGNPDTFAAAGKLGARVLTHLLGQSVAEVGEKLAVYRKAWRDAGHAGEGHVTMMLHSFVGPNAEAVRDAVRAPMIAYLRTSTGLVKQHAWSFPAFKQRPGMNGSSAQADLDSLSDSEMDQLLEHAFERYYETSGLFGTPEHCLKIVRELQDVGVDEIACLIDFGVPADQVLSHLPYLNALRGLAQPAPANPSAPQEMPAPIGSLLSRHGVTHLQCTPSMAQMLAADRGAHPGLSNLKQMMVGGEAFPPALARDLARLVGGRVLNMYGPTETTIWSAVHEVANEGSTIPLGRPLLNQQIYILDSRQQPVQPGVPGEIVIGGNGVVRGYHDRPELTAERFLPHPFKMTGRIYRTGDLGRHRSDGTIEYLGRLDHQVKLRGHRIELGEIEALLSAHPDIAEAIVCCREDTPGDVRLVAYYAPAPATAPDPSDLRADLAAQLPGIMVPSHLVEMKALPRTPNGKLDRNALPKPGEAAGAAISDSSAPPPGDGLEKEIAAIWCDVLKLPSVSRRDNFFDLGGHSLLAIQVHRRLQGTSAREPSITDIFRFPTIEALSRHLGTTVEDDGAMREAHDRAQSRKAARQRRHLGLRIPFDLAREA